MTDGTAALAQSITWAGSKQTYYTARLMVDRDLVNDFYRAYAYFRWVDDVIDVSSQSDEERASFISRQRKLIDGIYRGELIPDLAPEEQLVADLIGHDRGGPGGLQSFIQNMFAIIEFDAYRKGRLISQEELAWYSNCLGKSVTDGIQYFIASGHPYPASDSRYLAATAAHIAHLLRDTIQDTADGYVNIPREYLEAHGISPDRVDAPPFRAWVRERARQAREWFREGKLYLDELDVLRCKIVGHWYCTRFEGVLDTIEGDGYVLRAAYDYRRKLSTWLRIAWVAASVALRHIVHRSLRGSKSRGL